MPLCRSHHTCVSHHLNALPVTISFIQPRHPRSASQNTDQSPLEGALQTVSDYTNAIQYPWVPRPPQTPAAYLKRSYRKCAEPNIRLLTAIIAGSVVALEEFSTQHRRLRVLLNPHRHSV